MLPLGLTPAFDMMNELRLYEIPDGKIYYNEIGSVSIYLTPEEMDYYFEQVGKELEHTWYTNQGFHEDGFLRGQDINESAKWWLAESRKENPAHSYKLAHSYRMGWVKGKSARNALTVGKALTPFDV